MMIAEPAKTQTATGNARQRPPALRPALTDARLDAKYPVAPQARSERRPAMPRLTPTLALVAAAALAAPPSVDYPAGYRKWAHVKSMAIVSDKNPLYASFGGIHHVYANPEALVAFVKGGTFPDGSVIVFDLLEAKDENGA